MTTLFLGDSQELEINLSWDGNDFEPGEDWTLIFTVKASASDADAAAKIQKTTDAGITVAEETATIEIVPQDTTSLAEGRYLYDIQAQHVTTGEVRTVAYGKIEFVRDITRGTQTSIPVRTTQPPHPASVVNAINSAAEKTTPADGDRIPMTDSADGFSLKWFSWANLKATAKAYFDTLYAAISHTHDAADIVSGTLDVARLPENIPVDEVVLSDGSGVELSDGGLSLDASYPPKIMVHDGAITGGIPAEGWILRGAASFSDTDGIASDTELVLAELTLPTDFMANTAGMAVATLTGNVSINATNTGYAPATNPYLAIYFSNSTGGVAAGYKMEIPFDVSLTNFINAEINQLLGVTKTASALSFTPNAGSRNTVRSSTSSMTTDTLRAFSSYGTSLQRPGNITVPCPVRISLIIPQDVDSGAVRVNASCDLRLQFTQP